jgi:hypothetical protein
LNERPLVEAISVVRSMQIFFQKLEFKLALNSLPVLEVGNDQEVMAQDQKQDRKGSENENFFPL